jgi:hypothetical protein
MFIDFLHFSPTFQWLSVGVPTTNARARHARRAWRPSSSIVGRWPSEFPCLTRHLCPGIGGTSHLVSGENLEHQEGSSSCFSGVMSTHYKTTDTTDAILWYIMHMPWKSLKIHKIYVLSKKLPGFAGAYVFLNGNRAVVIPVVIPVTG